MFQAIVRKLVASMGVLSLAFVIGAAMAQAQDAPVRVRGTIDRVEGDTYIVKARGGGELKVTLAEKAMVVALIKASLAANGRWRCTSFPKRCAAWATGTAAGTCSSRAR